jgi:hypothetical protein
MVFSAAGSKWHWHYYNSNALLKHAVSFIAAQSVEKCRL